MSKVVWVHAYGCGHRVYEAAKPGSGIAWCSLCHGYVNVIVSRGRRRPRKR